MEGCLAAPLFKLHSLSLTFTVWLNLIFHFHRTFPVCCTRSAVRREQLSKGTVLKCTSLMELLWQTCLRAGAERQWKPVDAVIREQKDRCSKAGILPAGPPSFSPEGSCLPCHCVSLLSIRNSLRATAEQPAMVPRKILILSNQNFLTFPGRFPEST